MKEEDRRDRLEQALRRAFEDPTLRFSAGGDIESDWMERRLDVLMRSGADAVLYGAPGFPGSLTGIPDEPSHLFYLGRLPSEDDFGVAVVGTRSPTPSGARFAEEAGRALAGAGAIVVSGLARGVDGLAHRAALAASGPARIPSVAVIACGLDVCYPREHRSLFDELAVRGGIVTEFPPFAKPMKHHFIRRNRLLSGLSRFTVVVEARAKSGALVTAHYALNQGRDVAAVPGDIYSPPSAGTNRLIFEGAIPVTSVSSLLRTAEDQGLEIAKGGPVQMRIAALAEGVSDPARAVLGSLAGRARSIESLAAAHGERVERMLGLLLELELAGLVVRCPGGMVRRSSGN